jgi:dihydrofolate reductase
VASRQQQYLKPGLIDELQLAIAPVALGRGEVMVAGIDLPALGFRVTEHARDAYRA